MDDLFDDVLDSIAPKDITMNNILTELGKITAGNEREQLLIFLIGLTGYLEGMQQFSVIEAVTSTGKTYTLSNVVLTLFPYEDILEITDSSDTALFYEHGVDTKRIMLLSEVQKLSGKMLEIVKSLHSRDGGYKRKVTNIDRSVSSQQLNPMALFLSYAEQKLDEQLRTRCVLITLPEDITTNKKIIEFQAKRMYKLGEHKLDEEFISRVKKQIKRMNKTFKYGVIIPYADKIASIVDFSVVRSRSDIGKLFSLISAYTAFNGSNRIVVEVDGKKYFISEPEDAYDVIISVAGLLQKTSLEISDIERAILSSVYSMPKPVSLIKDDLFNVFELNPMEAQLRRYITKLEEKGYIEVNEATRPKTFVLSKVVNDEGTILKWSDIEKDAIANVKKLYPDVYEKYSTKLKKKYTHPITGEKIMSDYATYLIKHSLDIDDIEDVIKSKKDSNKKSKQKEEKKTEKNLIGDW